MLLCVCVYVCVSVCLHGYELDVALFVRLCVLLFPSPAQRLQMEINS